MEQQILTKKEVKTKAYPLRNSKEVLILKIESFNDAIRQKDTSFSFDNPKINNQYSLL
jgi:hypothetical protein